MDSNKTDLTLVVDNSKADMDLSWQLEPRVLCWVRPLALGATKLQTSQIKVAISPRTKFPVASHFFMCLVLPPLLKTYQITHLRKNMMAQES